MKIFKFGGASVRHAEGIRNLAEILGQHSNEHILTVISAIGKTTNHLEDLTRAILAADSVVNELLEAIKQEHLMIIDDLFPDKQHPVYSDTANYFLELECLLETVQPNQDYDHLYDQIVSYGELISTKIVSHYLQLKGIRSYWADARNFIVTDSLHREARVQWEETAKLMEHRLKPLALKNTIITQGFIGRDLQNNTTTLGREGSDYSAALFAWGLQAESVTIWKDVAGVMNADPKKFPFAEKLDSLTYNDAIELAYYGASVIHPKTIQPLQSVQIPLFVKSFLDSRAEGTEISNKALPISGPCYILKEAQCLIHIKSPDFNFMAEEHLSRIFSLMAEKRIRANLMQQSAISFSLCTDDSGNRFNFFLDALTEIGFNITVQRNLQLLTVYHAVQGFRKESILKNKTILLEQLKGGTAQYVLD
jgi:aspartate kinase